jgi:protoheme IX farnesyltransferase
VTSFNEYYKLAKPGIIYGNIITVAAGFFLAEKGHFSVTVFLAVMIGSALVMASGCVFNNYFDRDIDALMERTKRRASVTNVISVPAQFAYGTILLVVGLALLYWFTNPLTTLLGFVAWVFYTFVYTFAKRVTEFGTLIGSIPGAIPPLAGYTAVTNHIDGAAFLLFLILVLWQMPHFYAIAMYRLKDYEAAKIPVLPITKGFHVTKIHIMAYIAVFTLSAAWLTVTGYTGFIYMTIMIILGGMWFWKGLKGFDQEDSPLWARGMFKFSLLVLLGFSALLYVSAVLP